MPLLGETKKTDKDRGGRRGSRKNSIGIKAGELSSVGMVPDDGDVWPKVYLAPSNLPRAPDRIAFVHITHDRFHACCYFYWFLRIEWKNFRQQLIALLIMSDFFRTVLTFAFPPSHLDIWGRSARYTLLQCLWVPDQLLLCAVGLHYSHHGNAHSHVYL